MDSRIDEILIQPTGWAGNVKKNRTTRRVVWTRRATVHALNAVLVAKDLYLNSID
jgi:hypothetical protein